MWPGDGLRPILPDLPVVMWETEYLKDERGDRISDVHIIPIDDDQEHIPEIYCICKPTKEPNDVVTHHAFDEREVVEALLDELGIVDGT